MCKRNVVAGVLLATAVVVGGCSVNPIPAPTPNRLLAVTGRVIPQGQALSFVINPEAGKRVTINVQADTDLADPDFRVVRGEIDYEDLDSTPISDLILISADQGSGQEIGHFVPEAAEAYTLFIEDRNNWPGATFSITVTQ
ncbi:MAG: hypothetical protein KAV82_04825 [Phycisphaerae bacterium]|nr:hypothetical protein [Phycisphaerae bacterium]